MCFGISFSRLTLSVHVNDIVSSCLLIDALDMFVHATVLVYVHLGTSLMFLTTIDNSIARILANNMVRTHLHVLARDVQKGDDEHWVITTRSSQWSQRECGFQNWMYYYSAEEREACKHSEVKIFRDRFQYWEGELWLKISTCKFNGWHKLVMKEDDDIDDNDDDNDEVVAGRLPIDDPRPLNDRFLRIEAAVTGLTDRVKVVEDEQETLGQLKDQVILLRQQVHAGTAALQEVQDRLRRVSDELDQLKQHSR